MRLYFVLPCTSSLTVFVPLYFVLRPQVFQLVPRQPLTQAVRLFFVVQVSQYYRHCILNCFLFRKYENFKCSLKIVQLNNDNLNCQEIFFFFCPIESEFQFNTNANISEENFVVGVT